MTNIVKSYKPIQAGFWFQLQQRLQKVQYAFQIQWKIESEKTEWRTQNQSIKHPLQYDMY